MPPQERADLIVEKVKDLSSSKEELDKAIFEIEQSLDLETFGNDDNPLEGRINKIKKTIEDQEVEVGQKLILETLDAVVEAIAGNGITFARLTPAEQFRIENEMRRRGFHPPR